MKKLIGFLCVFFAGSAFLLSCTKEKSYEGGPASTDSLLLRMVSGAGSDSVSYAYDYDASRRVISRNYVSSIQGVNDNEQITIKRNGQGIILQIIHKSDSLKASGFDSLVYNVNYSTAKAQYTSQVASFTYMGIPISDSIAYTYNPAGMLIKHEEFIGAASFGGYGEYLKMDFTYDAASNVNDVQTSVYDQTSGAYQLASEEAYTYDNNINPLKQLGVEAFLLDAPPLYSAHNVATETITDPTDPTNDDVLTITYNYNKQNKPASASNLYKSSGTPVPVAYYYKL